MIRRNDIEYLPVTYLVNGIPFSEFGIDVMAKRGLFDLLKVKERNSISLPGQHGVIVDRTGSLYEARDIEFDLSYTDSYDVAREKLGLFRSKFAGPVPARLTMTEGYREYVWDVDWVEEMNREPLRWYAERNTVKLIETAPVKAVYLVTGAASFTTAPTVSGTTQEPVLFSWGERDSNGNMQFTDSVRAATTTHTYTDGYDTHIVIISGVLSLVTITTEHTLKYTVSY